MRSPGRGGGGGEGYAGHDWHGSTLSASQRGGQLSQSASRRGSFMGGSASRRESFMGGSASRRGSIMGAQQGQGYCQGCCGRGVRCAERGRCLLQDDSVMCMLLPRAACMLSCQLPYPPARCRPRPH